MFSIATVVTVALFQATYGAYYQESYACIICS